MAAAACSTRRWKVFQPSVVLILMMWVGMIACVSGDAALINNVCSKTSKPFYCKKCFEFYRQSPQENLKFLGRTSIGCVYSTYDIFRSSLGWYMINDKQNPGLQIASQHCLKKMGTSHVDSLIKGSLQSWEQGRFASASSQMWMACNIINDCGRELLNNNPPKSLATQLAALDGFAEASGGVLTQIH